MYPIAHTKKDGSFVNEETSLKNEQLQNEIREGLYNNGAFVKVFGKEHPGYSRGMEFGITPSQVNGSTPHSAESTSSFEPAEMAEMRAELVVLRAKVAHVDVLQEQVAFLMQQNAGRNQVKSLLSIAVRSRVIPVRVLVAEQGGMGRGGFPHEFRGHPSWVSRSG